MRRSLFDQRARAMAWRLDSRLAPEDVARRFGSDDRPFALIGSWAGGGALIGSEPAVVAARGDDPFELIGLMPLVEPPAQAAVGGGWFGYFGYQLGARVERLPPAPPRPVRLPPFGLAFYDHLLRYDRHDGTWWFEALTTPDRRDEIDRRRAEIETRLQEPSSSAPYTCGPFDWCPADAVHIEAVGRCRDYIHAGDIFQANLCLRLEAEFSGDPLALYTAGVSRLHAPYSAYVSGPWGSLASFSPELFLRREGSRVRTAPIKGTIRRDASESQAQRDELVASVKDRAENVMIVDLMRNDIGRVCRPGTVRVPELFRPEEHPGVWHLVSDITGELEDGVGDGRLLRACFPPGSVTGAPKVRAMEIIAELESTGREVYTGAIGYTSPVAGLELNVVIRTFEIAEGSIWLGAGGAIVADSDPQAELDECLTKAGPLIEAVGGRLREPDPRRGPGFQAMPVRSAAQRPDPAAGVFETMLVHDGFPLELDAHLLRLEASVAQLYGAPLPNQLRSWILTRARAGKQPHRLRVVVVGSASGDIDVEVELEPVDINAVSATKRSGVDLYPFALAGGLGPHKWRDRRLLEEVRREGGGTEPLVVDLDGSVLEAGRGNVIAVIGERVVTPPADGRILAGVTRQRVLHLAAHAGMPIAVGPIHLEELAAAGEVMLTGSVRGVEPVRSCEGVGTWEPGPVAERLDRALEDHWRPTRTP